jgi:hypothetical protein
MRNRAIKNSRRVTSRQVPSVSHYVGAPRRGRRPESLLRRRDPTGFGRSAHLRPLGSGMDMTVAEKAMPTETQMPLPSASTRCRGLHPRRW